MAGQTPQPAATKGPSAMLERPWGSFWAVKAAVGAPVRMLTLGQTTARIQPSIAPKPGLYSDPNLSPNIFPRFSHCLLAHGLILVTNDCSCLESVDFKGTTNLLGGVVLMKSGENMVVGINTIASSHEFP